MSICCVPRIYYISSSRLHLITKSKSIFQYVSLKVYLPGFAYVELMVKCRSHQYNQLQQQNQPLESQIESTHHYQLVLLFLENGLHLGFHVLNSVVIFYDQTQQVINS